MEQIRVAVVGLGSRALATWVPLLQRIPGYRITAICDPIAALHDQARGRLAQPGEVNAYTHYADVLADPQVDAVALTVRCQEQGAMAAQALEAGKHVNAEVPAAHTLEDCWRIVAAQERSGCVYQLAEQVRFAGFVDGWRKLVTAGQLGQITYCEGQYFHYYVEKSFQDPKTGQFYSPDEVAAHPEAQPTWLYHMPPIHYIVHDISPLLAVIEDRVVEVVAMSTASPSAAHPELISPDMQVALMKTAKGTLLRMAASFSQPHIHHSYHWLQIIGSKGMVEWNRSAHDQPKLWLADAQMFDKADVDWRYERTDAPPGAKGSGHSDLDYYVHVSFRDAVLGIKPLAFDVYKAMDTAAPAILAADSIAQGSKLLAVPSFLPDERRLHGQLPQSPY